MKKLILPCGTLLAIVLGLALGIGLTLGFQRINQMFGKAYLQHNERDVIELRRFTHLAGPALRAFEAYKSEHGFYPEQIEAVSEQLPEKYLEDLFFEHGAPYPSFQYWKQEDGNYRLYLKLNYEGWLEYKGQGQWIYYQEMKQWEVMPKNEKLLGD